MKPTKYSAAQTRTVPTTLEKEMIHALLIVKMT